MNDEDTTAHCPSCGDPLSAEDLRRATARGVMADEIEALRKLHAASEASCVELMGRTLAAERKLEEWTTSLVPEGTVRRCEKHAALFVTGTSDAWPCPYCWKAQVETERDEARETLDDFCRARGLR